MTKRYPSGINKNVYRLPATFFFFFNMVLDIFSQSAQTFVPIRRLYACLFLLLLQKGIKEKSGLERNQRERENERVHLVMLEFHWLATACETSLTALHTNVVNWRQQFLRFNGNLFSIGSTTTTTRGLSMLLCSSHRHLPSGQPRTHYHLTC